MDVAFEADFGDGRYRFELTPLQIIELQEKTGKGIVKLCADVQAGVYRQQDDGLFAVIEDGRCAWADIRETIRLALIGGNGGFVDSSEKEVGPLTAQDLCKRYVDPRPLMESWTLAAAILAARILGHTPKKKEGELEAGAGEATG